MPLKNNKPATKAFRKFKLETSQVKYKGEKLEQPVKATMMIPAPDDETDLQAWEDVWDKFEDWGKPYNGSDAKKFETPMWIRKRPRSIMTVLLEGLRSTAYNEASPILIQMAREQKGENSGMRRGGGVRAFALEGFDENEDDKGGGDIE